MNKYLEKDKVIVDKHDLNSSYNIVFMSIVYSSSFHLSNVRFLKLSSQRCQMFYSPWKKYTSVSAEITICDIIFGKI